MSTLNFFSLSCKVCQPEGRVKDLSHSRGCILRSHVHDGQENPILSLGQASLIPWSRRPCSERGVWNIQKSEYNHRMLWVEKDLLKVTWSNLQWAGTSLTISGCSESCPTYFIWRATIHIWLRCIVVLNLPQIKYFAYLFCLNYLVEPQFSENYIFLWKICWRSPSTLVYIRIGMFREVNWFC